MPSEKVAGLQIERIALDAMKPHPKNPRKHPKPGSPAWGVLRKSLERDYFDPLVQLYGGSGTTLLASEQIGRRCVVTELDPKYCAVILERAAAAGLSVERINDNIVVG